MSVHVETFVAQMLLNSERKPFGMSVTLKEWCLVGLAFHPFYY